MKRFLTLAMVAVLAMALLAVVAMPVSTKPATQHVYVAQLDPLNNSGVHGTAFFVLQGRVLWSFTTASGLTLDQVHMQHIHGFASGANATCPPLSADTDDDGIISLVEGLPFYGPVLVPLTPYPTASSAGMFVYAHVFRGMQLKPLRLGSVGLTHRVVVVHGMMVNGTYDMTVPVACGEIQRYTGSVSGM